MILYLSGCGKGVAISPWELIVCAVCSWIDRPTMDWSDHCAAVAAVDPLAQKIKAIVTRSSHSQPIASIRLECHKNVPAAHGLEIDRINRSIHVFVARVGLHFLNQFRSAVGPIIITSLVRRRVVMPDASAAARSIDPVESMHDF